MKQYRPRLDERAYQRYLEYKQKGNVGIIGDTHLPFTMEGYREFCYDVFDKYACDKIVHIGDLVDGHAWSYHESNPNGYSAKFEVEAAQKEIDKWTSMFPDVKMCIGNHDALVSRKLKTAGLPDKFLKKFSDMWELPKGWEVDFEFEIDGVFYTHGTGSSGQYAALNRAKEMRQSVVMGHVHHAAGCFYISNTKREHIFGLSVGCGIDDRQYAFEYGKTFAKRPNVGCGVVIEGSHGFYIPML